MSKRHEEALQILSSARNLLSGKDRWTWGALAENDEGVPVAPWALEACAWNITGAVMFIAARRTSPPEAREAALALLNEFLPDRFIDSEDFERREGIGQPQVLALFDEVLECFEPLAA